MDLQLTSSEEELIKQILEEHHRELLREIAKADHRPFRHDLRQREQALKALLNKLSGATATRKAG